MEGFTAVVVDVVVDELVMGCRSPASRGRVHSSGRRRARYGQQVSRLQRQGPQQWPLTCSLWSAGLPPSDEGSTAVAVDVLVDVLL